MFAARLAILLHEPPPCPARPPTKRPDQAPQGPTDRQRSGLEVVGMRQLYPGRHRQPEQGWASTVSSNGSLSASVPMSVHQPPPDGKSGSRSTVVAVSRPRGAGSHGLIIRLIIQTIRRDPSGAVWTDGASNVSRPDRSGADQIDAEHQATDLAVGGSNPSRRAPFGSTVSSRGQSAWGCA
jgi:hypothetical protein